jgi:hypothetical protein
MKTALMSLALWGGVILSTLGQTVNFSNTNAVDLVDNGPADPYPSSITITGAPWRVGKLTVTLSNLSHTAQSDVNVLLVGPQGQAVYLIAGPNGTMDFTHVTLTLDDSASSYIPSVCTSGRYKPTGYYPEIHDAYPVFPSPAPAGPYSADLAVFRETDPNGAWSLFAMDDEKEDSGVIEGGWSLSFEKEYPVALRSRPNGQLEVSWPDEAIGYILIATSSLQGDNWTVVPNAPDVVDGRKAVVLQPTSSQRFFKLIKLL